MTLGVFISYSHDSTAHEQRVLALADRLRVEGLDVRLDQYVAHPPEGWPRWTQRQVMECDFVVLVCTPTYRRRFDREETPAGGGGVAWEALLAEHLLYEARARGENLIPVLLEDGTEQDIPRSLRAFTYYSLPGGYDDLYRRLTRQSRTPPQPIGALRSMPLGPRPSVLERAHIDNRGASIGQQVVVHGSVSFGAVAISTPSSSPNSSSGSAPSVAAAAPAVILLCMANAAHPHQRLRLEEEVRAIDDALRRSMQRGRYLLRVCPAATFTKIFHELDDHEPTFVHFSGHGAPSGDLILKGERDDELLVPPTRMAELLEALRKRPKLVTFATSYSQGMAELAVRHAAFAIGFDGPLDDETALLFSATLYERLASRAEVDIQRAFIMARIVCQAGGHESAGLARLFEYPGREVR